MGYGYTSRARGLVFAMRGFSVKPVARGGEVMNEIYLSTKSYLRSKNVIFLKHVILSNENIISLKQIIKSLVESHIFERKNHILEKIIGCLVKRDVFERKHYIFETHT